MRSPSYSTKPLEEVVREIDPTVRSENLRRAVRDFLKVTNLRQEAHTVRGTIDLCEETPLFGGPILRLYTGGEVQEFQAAWRAFRACSPVTPLDIQKIDAIWPREREEPLIGHADIAVLRLIRSQATLSGYLNSDERTTLDRVYSHIAEAERLERQEAFHRLGLEWRERAGRLEPAKTTGRYTQATFVELGSPFFDVVLQKLPALPPEDKRELRRIYERCRELSILRQTGKHAEFSAGWDDFLENDLYKKYGLR